MEDGTRTERVRERGVEERGKRCSERSNEKERRVESKNEKAKITRKEKTCVKDDLRRERE